MTLVPHDAWWLATFYGDDPKRPFDTYVDIATPAVWHGEDLVRAVDLDLDVIQGTTGKGLGRRRGRVRGAPGRSSATPTRSTEQAVASCQEVLAAVTGRRPRSTARTATGWRGCAAADRAPARHLV